MSGIILENKPSANVPDHVLHIRCLVERKPQEVGLDSIYLPFVPDGSVSLMAGGVVYQSRYMYSVILEPPNSFCYKGVTTN